VVVMAAALRAQLRARGHSRTACMCGPAAAALALLLYESSG